MSYTLSWSDPSTKPNLVVNPGSYDTTSTSLTLSGKGALNYGESQQTNFIRLLENFASPTPPAHATKGQSWYNTTTGKMNIWNGSTWSPTGGVSSGSTVPVGPQAGDLWWNTAAGRPATKNIQHANATAQSGSGLNVYDGTGWTTVYSTITNAAVSDVGQVKVAFADEYNYMVDRYNLVAATPSGTTAADAYGYGQLPIAHQTVETLTNSHWVNLLTKIKRVCQHQGKSTGIVNGIYTKGFIYESGDTHTSGIVAMLGYSGNGTDITDVVGSYATTLRAAESITSNRFAAVYGSLESSAPIQGARSRSAGWVGIITHEILLTFSNINHMKAYFNSGGKVSVVANIPNSPTTDVNFSWNALLATIGTITLTVTGTSLSGPASLGTTNKGFYDLTTTPQDIFVGHQAGAYSQEDVSLKASLESGGQVLHLTLTLTSTGAVSAATTSSLILTKASELYLSDPEIAFPGVISSGTM